MTTLYQFNAQLYSQDMGKAVTIPVMLITDTDNVPLLGPKDNEYFIVVSSLPTPVNVGENYKKDLLEKMMITKLSGSNYFYVDPEKYKNNIL